MAINTLLSVTFVLILIKNCFASIGDRSFVFRKCISTCMKTNCFNLESFTSNQLLHLRLLQWDCHSECRYSCMWTTIDAFLKDGLPVPQFNGKWPFIRLFGIQEPASTLFSICNALCCCGIFYLRSKINSTVHMYYVWHVVSLISLNAWICSIIFHTRDLDITEKLDYYFAFSVVCCNLWAFLCRILGTENKWLTGFFTIILLGLYFIHVSYLHFVHLDYGYNMKVNILFGILNTISWCVWSLCNIKKQRYIWKCLFVVVSMSLLLSLELLDFPPIFWCLDAHALWHAGTVPLAIIWICFIVDDCKYIKEKQDELILKLD